MPSAYREKLLARRQTTELEAHPLSVIRDCLFNTLAAAYG